MEVTGIVNDYLDHAWPYLPWFGYEKASEWLRYQAEFLDFFAVTFEQEKWPHSVRAKFQIHFIYVCWKIEILLRQENRITSVLLR